ncbi:hypothetical protein LWV19_004320, partial [Salmonella enterica]|nr:hypothetical protein [Salmonella enterica]
GWNSPDSDSTLTNVSRLLSAILASPSRTLSPLSTGKPIVITAENSAPINVVMLNLHFIITNT